LKYLFRFVTVLQCYGSVEDQFFGRGIFVFGKVTDSLELVRLSGFGVFQTWFRKSLNGF